MRRLALVAIATLLAAGPAFAADAEAGAAVFKRCAACHAVGEGATNRVGPVLNDLFGRVAGTYEGFSYSKAMVDAGVGGLTWTEATLGQFLHKPRDMVAGTKMAFPGLPQQADIDNVVAYLLTLSPGYTPAAPAQ